ncbi:GntR family transcriptional regulator [Streptomyces sp. PT12]|uniref:GntR family transcriptional regulator n=1 Tax=Streptomyces sp. PT12 TaxID=1510197 RepID=UPI0015EEE177|nr:GntR family transcriptional regulator [Streptomyces sp. PT12]
MTDDERQGPAWRAIADQLRSDVADEVYPPGGPLPGETQLATRYEVSRPTVRRAINALVGEGLLSVSHGRGTFVRPRPDRKVILINHPDPDDLLDERYEPSEQGWLRGEHPRAISLGERADRAKGALITTAGRDEAEALGTRTGTWIFQRFQHWRHRTTHQVISLVSLTPAHLVGWLSDPDAEEPPEPADLWDHPERYQPVSDHQQGPPEGYDEEPPEDPDENELGPQPSLYDRLMQRGPVRFASSVTARMPVGDEVTDLDVPNGTPVLEVRRTMTAADGRPLEVTIVTAPADRFEAASSAEWLSATRPTGGDAAAVLRL